MVVEIDILGGGELAKFTDELMRACDLFEEGKRFVAYVQKTYTIDGSPDLDKFCENLSKAYEAVGGYAIFIGIRKVDGKRGNWPCWFAPGIHAVSMYQDNLDWGLFCDLLRQLDYEVQTDDRMKVISVS